MELQNVLQQRRSIRKYKQQPVEKEKIEEMIQAAIYSESWKNSQTPRYHVIQSKEMLEQFKKKCLPVFNQKNIADAPVLIVTTFVKDRAGFQRNGSPDNELQNGWGVYDCGLANQNLILKATELGLGTLVMGIRDERAIRELLEIPVQETIVSVIGVGYPNIEPSMPKRKTYRRSEYVLLMKKLLYKICKPHHKYKINLVDVLLLIEPVVMNTSYFMVGRIFLLIALVLNYLAHYLCHDDYSEFERRVLVSTMIIIALLLIYLIITGK